MSDKSTVESKAVSTMHIMASGVEVQVDMPQCMQHVLKEEFQDSALGAVQILHTTHSSWAQATDGRILAVHRVLCDGHIGRHVVPRDVFSEAHKKKIASIWRTAGEWFSSLKVWSNRTIKGRFPEVAKVVPEVDANWTVLHLNPRLLMSLASALGAKEHITLLMPPAQAGKHIAGALAVLPMENPNAFGVFMPVDAGHSDGADRDRVRFQLLAREFIKADQERRKLDAVTFDPAFMGC